MRLGEALQVDAHLHIDLEQSLHRKPADGVFWRHLGVTCGPFGIDFSIRKNRNESILKRDGRDTCTYKRNERSEAGQATTDR